jgi:hypothetical protein
LTLFMPPWVMKSAAQDRQLRRRGPDDEGARQVAQEPLVDLVANRHHDTLPRGGERLEAAAVEVHSGVEDGAQ